MATGTNGQRPHHRRRAAGALVTAVCATGVVALPVIPAAADTGVPLNSGECQFGGKPIASTPWSLQRLLTDQMWQYGKGRGVTVAVIDTGVDAGNPQVSSALAGGKSFVGGQADDDEVGHGTKVAGIIAARPMKGSGFFGLAPEAKILPLKTAKDEKGGNSDNLAKAINYAVAQGVDIINISQGTAKDPSTFPNLEAAVRNANTKGILITASAGNSGADGIQHDTYPAAYKEPNVLAVAASDRNNERAPFSQSGTYVDIAAPGVDMVSTVPNGGNCVDEGTSFSAPYVAGAAALLVGKLKAEGKHWTPEQLSWKLEQTADRVRPKNDINIGWGVVDPVEALKGDTKPTGPPTSSSAGNTTSGSHIQPVSLSLGESPEERQTRYAIYILGGTLLAVGAVVGGSIAIRDWRRKNGINTNGEAQHG